MCVLRRGARTIVAGKHYEKQGARIRQSLRIRFMNIPPLFRFGDTDKGGGISRSNFSSEAEEYRLGWVLADVSELGIIRIHFYSNDLE